MTAWFPNSLKYGNVGRNEIKKKLSDQKHASKLFHGKSEKDCHVFNKRKFISSYFNTWGVIFIYFLLITT